MAVLARPIDVLYAKLGDRVKRMLIDSSGDGYDLTPNTALQPYLGNYPLVPSDPLTKHALFNNGANNNATRADSCGIAVPITGDWSFHAVINPRIISGTDQTIFALVVLVKRRL